MTVAGPAEDLVQTLRDAGLRVTSQRVAVVGVLSEGGHLDVETVTSRARQRLGTLTSQAVYEMLRGFVEAGLVRRFAPPAGPVLFELDTSAHDHAACTSCGRVANIPRRGRRGPDGWEVREQVVVGLCPDCHSQR